MVEWIIALGSLTVILFIVTCVLEKRCLAMYEKNRKLERINEDLRFSVRSLKTQVSTLQNQLYINPNTEKMAALRMSLRLKQEEVEELREKIKKQNVLLKQKWEESKKCG